MGEVERWLTIAVPDTTGFGNVHVVPIDDLIKHTYEMHCFCEPRIQWYMSGCYYAVHNSWDDREIAERMN